MIRIRTALSVGVVGMLLTACGGAPATTAAPSVTATIPPVPVVALPTLPSGWARYEAPGAFTAGAPQTWMVLTTAERDDPAAATALKAKYPDYSEAIDTAIAQMLEQGIYLHAYDIGGDTSVFTTNVNVLRVHGPLNAVFAGAAAAAVQAQFKIEDPLSVESVTSPAGAYRYQFAENLLEDSLAGMQYLMPAGSDVYIMTFLTTVRQTEGYGPTAVSMAETFAAAGGGTATATPALTPNGSVDVGLATFDSLNDDPSLSGPARPLYVQSPDDFRYLTFTTYHNVPGGLDHTGTIAIANAKTGEILFGPFPTVGTPGKDGAPNVYWTATVDIVVPGSADGFNIIDSEPSTWSWNELSYNMGMARGTGYPPGFVPGT